MWSIVWSRIHGRIVDLIRRHVLATGRTVYAAPSAQATVERRREAFAEALDHAMANPRERVTFVTDAEGDVDTARAGLAGLELISADDAAGVEQVVRERRRLTGGVFPFWPIRFPERQRTVEAQPPETVAIVFGLADDDPFRLFLPLDQYVREEFGNTVVYIPIGHPQPVDAG